jgi:hypothetical protein
MASENFDIVMRVVGGKVASAEIAQVTKSTEESSAAQDASAASAGKASKSWIKHAAVLGAVYGGYKLLKGSVGETVELTRNTLAFQRATGLDMKTAQAWVVTAQHRDISVKQLQQSMGTLGRSLGATTKPTAATQYAFDKLGVSFDQLKRQSPEQRMDTLADAFKRLPNGIDKAALAQKLFGRAGQGLLPILNQGAKGMNDQLEEASKLVPPVAKNAAAAGNLMRQQRALNAMMIGLKVTIGTALIPILSGLMRIITPLAAGFTQAMSHSRLFRDGIYVLTAAIGGLLLATKVIIPVLRALGFAELAAEAPISIWVVGIAALAAAIYLAYRHIKVFHDAVNAVVNFLKNNWRSALVVAASVLLGPFAGGIVYAIEHLHQLESIAMSVVHRVEAIFNGLVGFVRTLPGKFTGAVSGIFNGLYNAAMDVFHKIESIFSNLGSSIKSDISKIPVVGGLLSHGLAAGGPVQQTGSYLVGERGPEIVTLTRGQTVIPNHAIGAAMGGGPATITVPVYLDRKQIALAVARYTDDQRKRR